MNWKTTMQRPAEREGIKWCHACSPETRGNPAYGPNHAFRIEGDSRGRVSLCGAIVHPGEVFTIGTFEYCSACVANVEGEP